MALRWSARRLSAWTPADVCPRARVRAASSSTRAAHPTRLPTARASPTQLQWHPTAAARLRTSSDVVRGTRTFSSTPAAAHGHLDPPKPGEELHVTFVEKDGSERTFEVSHGDNLLDIAQANDVEMEGACGGSCACSTCHVIVEDEAMFDKMEEADDDENDMLDLAFGLTETSRLGCQIKMNKELDGLRVRLPSMTRNLQASDFSGR